MLNMTTATIPRMRNKGGRNMLNMICFTYVFRGKAARITGPATVEFCESVRHMLDELNIEYNWSYC